MPRYAAFLRAVNVGSRRVRMTTARDVLTGLGFDHVSSYANTGNFLFSARGSAQLEARIRAAMEDVFGFELTTFVRTAEQLERLVTAEPFGTIDAGHTYFALFPLTPLTAAQRRAVEAMSNERDEVVVIDRDVHWLIRSKSTETSLGPRRWLAALPGNPTTARNMTLLRKLAARLPA